MAYVELKRTIVEVFNCDTEREESALDLLTQKDELVFQLRRLVESRIQEQNPLYFCNVCGQAIVVRSHRLYDSSHTFYFKHLRNSGDCPIKTDSSYTKDEIRCMKYNGAKESRAHFELKHYLAEQLKKDNRFTNTEIEEVIKASGWSRKWKKPDISALFNGRKVVFEIQLSTTFLDVIVSREVFYQEEKIPIFWIFKDLNPEIARATEKDVFFNNKSNALSIDDFSKKLSQLEDQIVFTGHFRKPYFDSTTNTFKEIWNNIPVKIDDIKFDSITHKPYFILFDESLKKEKIHEAIQSLEELILKSISNEIPYELLTECAKKLASIGLYDKDVVDYGFLNFLKALLSVRDGEVYFANQEGKWAWVANYVYDNHIKHWRTFIIAIEEYKREELKVKFKNNDNLKKKHQSFKDNRQDIKFEQERTYYSLFENLLPKLKGKLYKAR